MADKFIDPVGGSDLNSGDSDAAPRKTPPAVTNNMNLRFKRGTTYTQSGQWSWGAASDVELSDYGDANAPAPILTIDAPASTNAINIQGAGVHTIQRVQFHDCRTNTNGGVLGAGLVAATSKGANLLVQDCIVRRCNWNFVRLGTFTTQAPDTFRMLRCDLDDIGEDGVFGGAQQLFEVAYCSIRNVSTNTTTGDCVGFFNTDPALVWVHHNHFYNPLNFKQVVIIDTTTPSGRAIVEFNEIIGYVGPNNDNQALLNTDIPTVIRGNTFTGSGIHIAMGGDGTVIHGNVFNVRGYRPVEAPINGTVGIFASNTTVSNNAFIADQIYDQTGLAYLITTGSGRSGNAFRNNIIANVAKAVQRGNGTTLTLSNNGLFNVAVPYVDHLGTPITSTNDVTIPNLNTTVASGGSLIVPDNATIETVGAANPLARSGTYTPGVTLANGRLRPGYAPIGAYMAVVARADR